MAMSRTKIPRTVQAFKFYPSLPGWGKQAGQKTPDTVGEDMGKNSEDEIILNYLGLPGWGRDGDSECQTSQMFEQDVKEKLGLSDHGLPGWGHLDSQVPIVDKTEVAFRGIYENDTPVLNHLGLPGWGEHSGLKRPDSSPNKHHYEQSKVFTPPTISTFSFGEIFTQQALPNLSNPFPEPSSPHHEASTNNIFQLDSSYVEKDPGDSLKRRVSLASNKSLPRRRRFNIGCSKAKTDRAIISHKAQARDIPESATKPTSNPIDGVIGAAVKESLSNPVSRVEKRREDREKLMFLKVPNEPNRIVFD